MGERVCLPAYIDVDVDKIEAVLPTLIYSISPTLPPGLDLDPNSGTISGVCGSAHGFALYTVMASINSYTVCGIFIGSLPVTGCGFSLRVVGVTAGS